MELSIFLVTFLVAFASAAPHEEVVTFGLPNGRIVGGQGADPHEFPWQVTMQWNYLPIITPRGQHYCGGAIIEDNVIITAAHCAVDLPFFGRFEIYAGKHYVSAPESTEQMVLVKNMIVHEKFGSVAAVAPFDVALIITDKRFSFTKEVQPVDLPEPGDTPTGKVTLSGWGSASTTQVPIWPLSLMKVTTDILDYDECYETIGHSSPLHECNICTGPLSGGTAACSGDSGSPLVQTKDGKTTIVGVVSWGYVPCGGRNNPSVYTKVSYFIDWILEKTKSTKSE